MSASALFVAVGNWRSPPDVWTNPLPSGLGFQICRLDGATGELTRVASDFGEVSVGSTCVDAERLRLYCPSEIMTSAASGFRQGGGGQVWGFAIDPKTGGMTAINHQPSYGTCPSYVAVSAGGKFLICIHHTGFTPVTKVGRAADGRYRIDVEYDDVCTVLFPLDANGAIGEPCHIYRHTREGYGPLPRQTHAQVHSVMASPSGRLFVACDKGADVIYVFRIDEAKRELVVCSRTPAPHGSTPRYSAFHPAKPYVFVNFETRAEVASFRYGDDGQLAPIGTVSSLPDDVADNLDMKQSDLRVHPNGKYLYSLIRGISSAAVFAIDEASGKLTRIQTVALDGKGPRGCAISPDGRFMLFAMLLSQEVVVWSIGDDGKLSPTGKRLAGGTPGNVTFF